LPGVSVFYKDEGAQVFHTYSTYARGLDALLGGNHYLDLTPRPGFPYLFDLRAGPRRVAGWQSLPRSNAERSQCSRPSELAPASRRV
jgi:hypothetical protein